MILYGEPGTGKTLLAKAVANSTSATFLRVVGSELIQKYLGDGPKLVRELFRVADDLAPSIVFIGSPPPRHVAGLLWRHGRAFLWHDQRLALPNCGSVPDTCVQATVPLSLGLTRGTCMRGLEFTPSACQPCEHVQGTARQT